MKVAYVHDDLMRRGGAERVLLALHKIYPNAPIFTLAYSPNNTYQEFKHLKIVTSWFQKIAINEKVMKWLFFPLGVWAMRSINLKGYDLVIISTTFGGKFVKVSKEAFVITYCYTPFRFVWRPDSYHVYQQSTNLKRFLFDWVIAKLKRIDKKAAQRSNLFIAMTEEMRQRILNAYHPKNEIKIVNPPVELSGFNISDSIGDYYLVVSRFEPYKKVDLVIETFNQLDEKLIIVGKGTQETFLKSIAGPNIIFKNGLTQDELSIVYSKCKALIFPQYEDYGLTPLEANASGRPVIAYKGGGVIETMIEYQGDDKKSTAVLFEDQTIESLKEAIELFRELNFDPNFLRSHSEKFSEKRFLSEIEVIIKQITEEN